MVGEKEAVQNNAYIIGVILIVLGVIFLLDKLGILGKMGFGFDTTDLWPILLIIIGIDIIYMNKRVDNKN